MSSEELRFTADFAPATYEAWVAEVDKVLKGAPFEKRMLHRSYEGITIQPLYTRKDWPGDGDPAGFPGGMPFTRGSRATAGGSGWDVCQEQGHPDAAVANREILTDLERGVTSIVIRFDAAGRSGMDGDNPSATSLAGDGGVMVYSVDDLDRVLADVLLDAAPVGLDAGAQALPAAAMLMALWKRRGVADESALGAFNADPLGTLAATGSLPVGIDQALAATADLAAYTAKTYPNVTAVGVNTAPYHAAGASESDDLACAMATGVAYLRALTGAGLDVDAACGQIAFAVPVSCDQFTAIAKLRAARTMWARIAEASGASEGSRGMHLRARSDDRMMSQRDPWVNMLRGTVACFAAAVGGADSITVQPFDTALGLPDDLSRRVARNTQLVLMEESHLGHVIDAAGGSWYVETLTNQLADAAWAQFQAIEKAGGIAACLQDGSLAARIDQTYAERVKNLARRKDPVTGVSEFPNVNETLPSHPAPDIAALKAAAGQKLAALRSQGGAAGSLGTAGAGELTASVVAALSAGATLGTIADGLSGAASEIAALPQRRLPAVYEELRDASDAERERTGRRPGIFLANLGPIAKHTARATFAKNFFETGGLEALSNEGFSDAESCAKAFRESGARIAIICSADPVYEEMVGSVAPALKAAGCEKLFLAGHPGDKRDQYTGAGVDDFIFLGGNVLDTLRGTLGQLGVIGQ